MGAFFIAALRAFRLSRRCKVISLQPCPFRFQTESCCARSFTRLQKQSYGLVTVDTYRFPKKLKNPRFPMYTAISFAATAAVLG